MSNLTGLGLSEVQADDFSALPKGNYRCVVTEAEIKPTKTDPTVNTLALKIEIIDGQYKGRLIFENLNLWHKNPQVVEISKKKLKSLSDSLDFGEDGVSDTSELINKVTIMRLACKNDENNVNGFLKDDGSAATTTQAAPAAEKRPWE